MYFIKFKNWWDETIYAFEWSLQSISCLKRWYKWKLYSYCHTLNEPLDKQQFWMNTNEHSNIDRLRTKDIHTRTRNKLGFDAEDSETRVRKMDFSTSCSHNASNKTAQRTTFPSTRRTALVNKIPKLCQSRQRLLTWEENSNFFHLGTVASDLKKRTRLGYCEPLMNV